MRATCARWAQSCARSTSTRRKRLAPHLDACKHAHVCHHSPRCRRHRVCTSTLLTPSRCRSLPCCPCRPFPLVTPAPFQQLQRWIHEMEEEEPTGFIVYEKVCSAAARGAAQACRLGWTLAAASPQSCLIAAPLPCPCQFETVVVRLLTEEASQHKRNTEDEILAAFQTLDAEKKGYLEQVSRASRIRSARAGLCGLVRENAACAATLCSAPRPRVRADPLP